MVAKFDVDKFLSELETEDIGRNLVYKEVTDTTMNDAREDGRQGCPYGTIHLTEIQTRARGVRAHTWNALNRDNLYFSVVLYRPVISPDKIYREIFDLEVIAGMAVLRIGTNDLHVKEICLKWPNDVWVRGHKICGILVEDGGITTDKSGNKRQLFVLGVGLNVNSDLRRHPQLNSIATSMRCENNGGYIEREHILAQFCKNVETLLSCDHSTIYQTSTRSQLFDRGLKVKVTDYSEKTTFDGTVTDITPDWLVTVKDESGNERTGGQDAFSLRPIPPYTILVYNGEMADRDSSSRLQTTLQSLVNTVTYTVNTIADDQLLQGDWQSNTAILVIGELKRKDDQGIKVVQEFIQNGGSSILVKSGIRTVFPDAKVEETSEPFALLDVNIKYPIERKSEVILHNTKISYPKRVIDNSRILCSNGMSDPISFINTFGEGKYAVFGYNVELSYFNLQASLAFSGDVICNLSKCVFDCDVLLQYVISQLHATGVHN